MSRKLVFRICIGLNADPDPTILSEYESESSSGSVLLYQNGNKNFVLLSLSKNSIVFLFLSFYLNITFKS
jgi:hypothetical protein